MTLPDRCDVCAWPLMPWDDTEATLCVHCGCLVQPWEMLTPEQVHRRTRLIQRRIEIDTASVVKVSEDVL